MGMCHVNATQLSQPGITVLFPVGESLFPGSPKGTPNCATAHGSMCLHPTPGQQHEAAHGCSSEGEVVSSSLTAGA